MSHAAFKLFQRKSGKDVDMTQGSILRHLIMFAFPLLIGNLFQQLYNTVDTWVVGNYVSNEAFSAVGAVAPVVNMFIGTFTGLASGAGVVISQYYGAGRQDKVKESVHTAVSLTLILCIAFTFLGILITPLMLNILDLHPSCRDEATAYLTIYFSGITGLLIYNMGAGILRAIGDSRRPFYFLLVSAVLNTVLDLLFVLKFEMGVDGVALATIIAQGTSAILVVITLLTTKSCIKVTMHDLCLRWDILKKVFRVGIPAALQMTVTSFSNTFVLSYITHFDAGLAVPCVTSGWTAYLKIDQVLFLPMQSTALAATTFVGQNLGAGQTARAKKGVTYSMLLAVAATLLLMIPILIWAPNIVGFLNAEPAVVEYGTLFLYWLTPFYVLCSFNQVYASALRGAGNSFAPMIMMLTSFVGFRQLYLFIMSGVCNEIIPIVMCYPIGWILCSLLTGIYYHKTSLTKKKLIE